MAKITNIKTDSLGCKLIAYRLIEQKRRYKPRFGSVRFCDYTKGELTFRWKNDSATIRVHDYKAALKYILSL